MKAHTEQEFHQFMSQLYETNVPLNSYTDFKKCGANVERIAMRLNQLNYLIGQQDMETAVRLLWEENPAVFEVLDILIAVRKKDKKMALDKDGVSHFISNYFTSADGVIKFLDETGLKDVFQNKQIKNIVDYVFGIEVGLDSNARKNRNGDIMENFVETILNKAGLPYQKEVQSNNFPTVNTILGKDTKRFDFVVQTMVKTYLIEVNFYSGGGSKLNEVARAYTEIGPKINSCEGFEFVWITDGKGWKSARSKLAEAFYAIPNIYNLTTINEFISKLKND